MMVAKGHYIDMHNCNKKCRKNSVPSKPKESTGLWKAECISNSNPDRNIYSYCKNTFDNNEILKHNCSVDACRLCCATHDQAFHNTSASLQSIKECFTACAEKFPLKNRKK